MNIPELCKKISIQEYRMYSGFSYNEAQINNLQRELAALSKKEIKKTEDRRHRLWHISNVAENYRSRSLIKLVKKRAGIKYGGVTYANWRTWLKGSSAKQRKRVMDYFVSKSNKLTPLIERMFNSSRDVYDRYGESVLDAYLSSEGFSYRDLTRQIKHMGQSELPNAKKLWENLGIERAYYNEYYYINTKIYGGLKFNKKPIPHIKKIYKKFHLDYNKLKVDDKDRKNKFGFAYCFWPNPPYDVRVSYKPVGGFNEFETAFHEFGHAAHALSMNPKLPFWKRYDIPNGISETFSFLLESIPKTRKFLESIGAYSAELAERINMEQTRFISFYAANSIVKLKYWNGEIKFDEIGQVYSDLLKKYVSLEVPEGYWAYHHILSESDIYAPSYMIAEMHTSNLLKKLRKIDRRWWDSDRAVSFAKKFMHLGGDALEAFKENGI